jgi:hypothetical protein
MQGNKRETKEEKKKRQKEKRQKNECVLCRRTGRWWMKQNKRARSGDKRERERRYERQAGRQVEKELLMQESGGL